MKLPDHIRSRKRRALALPMTLFFVLIAFFAASTLAARSHYEAQATIVEILNIRREALARSALSTGLAMLEGAGTDEAFAPFTLQGPGGLKAQVHLEPAGEDLVRLKARVEGGLGQPYVAQKILRKRPQLIGIDVVHLLDGDLTTPDALRYRVVGSDEWVDLPSHKTSLLWVRLDRRGNLFSSHFPALEGASSPDLPEGFVERLIARNDELTREGNIDHSFFKKASQALEENWDLDLNRQLGHGINAGFAGNAGSPGTPQLEANPEFIRPARTVAKALSRGAEVDFQSQEAGVWESIDLELGSNFEGFPGRVASDGKAMYLPLLVPGEDRLRRYDLRRKTWSELPPPPALSSGGGASGGGTKNLLQVEVDDDGNLYAHHGDDGLYGISKYDAHKKSWSRLPSPPGSLALPNGETHQVMEHAEKWDGLSVGEQGEVYVVWRAGREAGFAEKANKIVTQTLEKGDLTTAGFGPGNAGNGGYAGNSPYGGAYGGHSPNSTGGLGTPAAPSNPYLSAGSSYQAFATENLKESLSKLTSGYSPQTSPVLPSTDNFKGFGNPTGFLNGIEVVMQFKDGVWQSLPTPMIGIGSLGSLRTGIDGRILLHTLNPSWMPDFISSFNGDGMADPPEAVPGLDGQPASYFAVDSGAKRVLGKYTFRETAEY